jgi:hypothetical protein
MDKVLKKIIAVNFSFALSLFCIHMAMAPCASVQNDSVWCGLVQCFVFEFKIT